MITKENGVTMAVEAVFNLGEAVQKNQSVKEMVDEAVKNSWEYSGYYTEKLAEEMGVRGYDIAGASDISELNIFDMANIDYKSVYMGQNANLLGDVNVDIEVNFDLDKIAELLTQKEMEI